MLTPSNSVTTDYTDDNVVRAIIGPAVWGLESTMGASPVLKQIRTANQENEKNSKESDSDPHEYVSGCHSCLES